MNDTVISNIQRWVVLDNKVELKKSKMKEYADERKRLEDEILNYVEDNQKANMRINISDGFIDFQENKSQQMITLRYVKDALNAFFEGNPTEVTASSIVDYLLQNRETKTKLVMRRHISTETQDIIE
jgi:translation initiation factor 2B subunit (eIF-2B alpha/beta/delta family)